MSASSRLAHSCRLAARRWQHRTAATTKHTLSLTGIYAASGIWSHTVGHELCARPRRAPGRPSKRLQQAEPADLLQQAACYCELIWQVCWTSLHVLYQAHLLSIALIVALCHKVSPHITQQFNQQELALQGSCVMVVAHRCRERLILAPCQKQATRTWIHTDKKDGSTLLDGHCAGLS